MGRMSKAGWMFLAGRFAAFSSGVVEWRFCWFFCKMQREKRGAFVVNRGANVVICVAKLTANSALKKRTGFRDLFFEYKPCPAGRAHCAWRGRSHAFFTRLLETNLVGPPVGRNHPCRPTGGLPSFVSARQGIHATKWPFSGGSCRPC